MFSTHLLRNIILAAGLLVAGAIVPLSATQPGQAAGNAYVRVFHASPDAPAVAVYVDGAKAVKTLSYPSFTGFLKVPAGSHHVQVFPASATYTAKGGVINATLPLTSGTYYTVAAIGTLKTLAAKVFTTSTMVNKTKATVGFVHFAPGAPAVDIEAKGAGIVFKNTAFSNLAAKPIEVAAGSYTLIVHPAGADKTVVLTVPGVAFKAGHSYTVAAIGLLKGMGAMKLSATVLDNTPMMSAM